MCIHWEKRGRAWTTMNKSSSSSLYTCIWLSLSVSSSLLFESYTWEYFRYIFPFNSQVSLFLSPLIHARLSYSSYPVKCQDFVACFQRPSLCSCIYLSMGELYSSSSEGENNRSSDHVIVFLRCIVIKLKEVRRRKEGVICCESFGEDKLMVVCVFRGVYASCVVIHMGIAVAENVMVSASDLYHISRSPPDKGNAFTQSIQIRVYQFV